MPEERGFAGKRFMMYVIGAVFNLSSGIPAYINSTFLAKFTGTSLVGIVYSAASILALIAFVEMSDVLRRWGNLRTTIALLFVEIVSLAGLSTGQTAMVVVASFLLNFVVIALINFTLDVFLEQFSSDRHTGKIRGTFLTIENCAWLVAPLLASWILGDNIFGNMYAVAGILIIPVVFLLFFSMREVKDPQYQRIPFWKSFATVWGDDDLKGILFVQFLLQFFYGWMIIYAPIYLNQTMGFGWPTIGIIFTVMLAPFVMLEVPLGRLADKIGEKRVLHIGFIVMAVTTGIIGIVSDHSAILWAAILFGTRCGAAMVEVMSDAYFFKHVDASNTHIITFSRMMRPMAYVVGPIIATILFVFFDIKGLFVFLGLLMLYGLRFVAKLKETRVLPEV